MGVCNPAYSCACSKPGQIGRVAAGRASRLKMGEGLMEVDCLLVPREWRPPGLSVCLHLVILPSTTKSRRVFLVALAHPSGPGKMVVKRLWCGIVTGLSE